MAIVDGKFIPELFTSEEILAICEEDIAGLERITEHCRFKYQLTEAEQGWLDWIYQRYAVGICILDNLRQNEETPGIVLIDTHEIGVCLAADGLDRAPCLDEDTALAKLIWFIGPEESDDDE